MSRHVPPAPARPAPPAAPPAAAAGDAGAAPGASPPAHPRIPFRAGTWDTFLTRMLARLPQQQVVVDGRVVRPLEGMDPGSSGDFVGALLDAWAMVGDVLTFYQERILNEGFLRTAVEHRSVRMLAEQLGMPLQPGLASRTLLAFQVSGAPGAPDAIDVPAGTAAQSIPGTGETPQTFETSTLLRARPAWNALTPAPAFTTIPPSLSVHDTQARLQGTGTGLTVGAPLLAAAGDGQAWTFGTVTAVEPSTQTRETRVAWARAPGGTRGDGALTDPAVWAFGRTARLFGYNAPAWSSLTTEQKRAQRQIVGGVFALGKEGDAWTPASGGLPATDVQALAVDDGGRLYAGTAGRGIWVSADGGRTWTAGGPRYLDVYSFAVAAGGMVYAGASRGRVYRSCDGGASWDSVSGGTTLTTGIVGQAELVATGLPSSPVRALFADGGTLYAGTDFGVYQSPESVPAWSPVPPPPLPRHTPSAGPPPPTAWCFASLKTRSSHMLFAGTDTGVWWVPEWKPVGTWPASPAGLPGVVRALFADATVPAVPSLLAATDAGLFLLLPHMDTWTPVPGPEKSDGAPLPVTALVDTPRGLMAATSAGVFLRHRSDAWKRDEIDAWKRDEIDVWKRDEIDAWKRDEFDPWKRDVFDAWKRDEFDAWKRDEFAWKRVGPPPAAPPPRSDCRAPTPVPAPPGLNAPGGRVALPPGDPPRAADHGAPAPHLRPLPVTALAAGAGVVAAACPYAGFAVEAWPGPAICGHTIYLSGVLPQVVPGSWMVLQQAPDPSGGGPAARVALVRVAAVRTLTLERYGRRGQATEVRVEPVKGLARFGRGTTTVFAAPRQLALVRSRLPDLVPVGGTTVRLAGAGATLPPGRQVSVSGRRIRAAVWPRAGVFVSGGTGWTPAGLASVDVVAVGWGPGPGPGSRLLAAVGGAPGAAGPAVGLYASDDGGATWTPAAGVLDEVAVHALASGPGAVWAAAPAGAVFSSVDGGKWACKGRAGQAVTALLAAPDGEVYAATADAGVLRRVPGGWSPAGLGRPPGRVRALAATAGGGLAAATADGVWWLAAPSARWVRGSDGLHNRDVRALAALPGGEVLAGTAGAGVFRARVAAGVPEGAWEAASTGLSPAARTVTALAATADGQAWAGTRGAGCWTLGSAAGAAWTAASLGAANDVRALAAGPAGVAAGCGGVPLLAGEGRVRASLALDPLLALADDVRHDLDKGALPPDLRTSFADAGVPLSAQAVVRVQQAGEAWWIAAPDGVLLLRRDAGAVRVRRPGALATLMGPSPTSRAGVAVADPQGHAGTLTPRTGEFLWQPSSPASPPVGEVAVVDQGAAAGLTATTLTLRRPLRNAYDPATVQLCGNLVPATQGATQGAWPRTEVLGSGNASAAGQSFALARGPLTWLAPGVAGSTLRVWVNGVEWTQVETLFGCGPGDAAYAVTVDETGAATVHFGDGVNGARLPTGTGNVTAQYRVGVGPGGDLGTGRVTVPRAVPLGVRSVVNPVPAEGAAPGQTVAQAVATAPVRARVLDRVVGLRDYADFAATSPGITRAVATAVRDPRGRVVVAVTVVGQPAAQAPDAGLLAGLVRDMRQAGAHDPFRVLPCETVGFVVEARVTCLSGWRPQAVGAAAAGALRQAYAPERRPLGQGLAASAVVALLQGVPGVAGVELTAFHRESDTPRVATHLEALDARVGPRGVLAAQLLVPAPGGITIHCQEAR